MLVPLHVTWQQTNNSVMGGLLSATFVQIRKLRHKSERHRYRNSLESDLYFVIMSYVTFWQIIYLSVP